MGEGYEGNYDLHSGNIMVKSSAEKKIAKHLIKSAQNADEPRTAARTTLASASRSDDGIIKELLANKEVQYVDPGLISGIGATLFEEIKSKGNIPAFNKQELLKLKDFQQIEAYAMQKYSVLGRGTSRSVYDYSKDKPNSALKVAFNNAGIAQNKNEHKVLKRANADKLYERFVPDIYDFAPDYRFLIS
jgi:hypothetical protein